MEEETTGHFLITEEHDADAQPVYRILSLGPAAAPPDVFATREDAEQWVAAWSLRHGTAERPPGSAAAQREGGSPRERGPHEGASGLSLHEERSTAHATEDAPQSPPWHGIPRRRHPLHGLSRVRGARVRAVRAAHCTG